MASRDAANVTRHRSAPEVSNIEVERSQEHWRDTMKQGKLRTKMTSYMKTVAMKIIRLRAVSYMI